MSYHCKPPTIPVSLMVITVPKQIATNERNEQFKEWCEKEGGVYFLVRAKLARNDPLCFKKEALMEIGHDS